jgi:PEP-CTERM motif
MKLKSALAVFFLSTLCLVPRLSLADTITLTLTGTSRGSAAGVSVYPYQFTVAAPGGTQTNVDLSCLNFDREITYGESWLVDLLQLSTINPTATYNGELGFQFLEDAWLFNQYNTAAGSTSEIQFAIWSIMDPGAINASNASYNVAGAFDATAQSLAAQAANEAATLPPSYFAGNVAFLPDANGSTTWTDGQPQIFMADPPPSMLTPEPASLLLLGTGFIGLMITMRGRLLRTDRPPTSNPSP